MNAGPLGHNGDRTLAERQRARRFFNRAAPAFGVIDRHLKPQYREVLNRLSFPAEFTVLDIGTGTGNLAGEFIDRGHLSTGIDVAERMIEKARMRMPAGVFRSMDLVDLDTIPSRSFDIVSMAYVLHGLSSELRGETLRQAARLAREGILIFDYAGRGPWYVRLIEWIEGPHYPSFVACALDEHIAAHRLEVSNSGRTSTFGGWWWCRINRASTRSQPGT